MATLEELKKELAREKNYAKSRAEIESYQSEKNKIQKEILALRRERKYGSVISTGRQIGSGLKQAWGKFEQVAGNARKELERKENRRLW